MTKEEQSEAYKVFQLWGVPITPNEARPKEAFDIDRRLLQLRKDNAAGKFNTSKDYERAIWAAFAVDEAPKIAAIEKGQA